MTLPEIRATARELRLTTVGRRSRRPRSVTLWFAMDRGALWLLTIGATDWVANLRADRRCSVRIGRSRFAARAILPRRSEALLDRLRALFRERYGAKEVRHWYTNPDVVAVRLVAANAVSDASR